MPFMAIPLVCQEYRAGKCLHREIFRNGRVAQVIVEAFSQEYNNYRLHSSLGNLMPAEFARQYYENKQVEEITQPG